MPGTVLGAYRVEGTIGAGSMGEVFKGIDTGLNRRVAIKILSEKHRDSPELRARFVREGRAVAAISHANVVSVFATGSFDERPYIAMELLDGTDLGSAVEKDGPLDNAIAAHAVLDAAQGLAAAAKAGLIHRDVKPSNLVRLSNGLVKVTDFGLAKPVDPGAEPALTAMGVVVGTPDYIAPEQARGEKIDDRVDIYALGGSLYFMLTGIPPFRTGKPAEDKYLKVVARHLRNPPPDATVANPRADRDLAELARMMMAKKPLERPSYADLVQRLTAILTRLDPEAVPEIVVAARDRSRPNTAPNFRASSQLDDAVTIGDSAGGAALSAAGKRGLPVWLIAFTVLCVGVFVAGLVVYLKGGDSGGGGSGSAGSSSNSGGSAGSGSSAASGHANGSSSSAGSAHGSGAMVATPPDASVAGSNAAVGPGSAIAELAGSNAGSADPQPPDGMIVVKPPGKPTFFVSTHEVTVGDFKSLFADHAQPATSPDEIVVSVSYDQARSFVEARGGRLLRDDEWDTAAVTPGFVVQPELLEWVEADGDKRIARQHGKHVAKTGKADKDVSFRVAKDL
jgi:serine/threonine-protein kinase